MVRINKSVRVEGV